VTPGGAARAPASSKGDVITTVAGRAVTPDESLAYLVSQQPVGSRVPIETPAQRPPATVTVQVAERPTEEELARLNGIETEQELTDRPADQQSAGQRSARASLGITVQALTPEVARSLRITDTNVRGVVVTSVDPQQRRRREGRPAG
jgi:serine protease Do